ncbi:uncharacterized protein (TIGR03086 family) [Antricoccus suffuscus]|uniref:Uncharacterized protein (TIGR03086 family) n=1 Tax=Antricoccus suffuscus TaxID=1629062 RepID=A0A2T1A6S9_9ACTN|nr:TIGR03086 family metal-binding protein [Antricoccus suffuscus]PRZ44300.1 uncharacterized protein (TIGR03086 family) [Antricoccus suffuscus]
MSDIREVHERVIQLSTNTVSNVSASDLDRPTPCAGWTLRDLLEHMITQHYGFAAAAAGNGAERGVWELRSVGTHPVAEYAAAAEHVVTAFSLEDVLERQFALPEISEDITFPGKQAIGFHLIDYVVHSWDVAQSIGESVELDPDIADIALKIAAAVPNGDERKSDGAAFAPAQSVPSHAAPLDQILALLGRSPDWTA